ncbi:MAG: helix-turn-helix transcriptional regulator [Firmicutes bacterium]|nr:helix-turn-helix transcriptional regulator [Bacillota bacterium]
MELSPRQKKILELAKEQGPITGEEVANHLSVTRAALRPDLAILTMAGLLDARPRVGYTYSGKSLNFFNIERLKMMKVREVCSVPAVISDEKSAYDAIVTMFLEDVGTLIVVDENSHLAGVVTRSDLLKNSLGSLDLEKVPVGVVMTRLASVIYVTPEETVLTAARKLLSHRISTMPVVKPVNEGKQLEVLGVISQRTITRLFVEIGEGH